MNREEENREESVFFGALVRKTTVLESNLVDRLAITSRLQSPRN